MIALLDANALIYLIEGAKPLRKRVRDELQRLAANDASLLLAMSALSRLECRVGPMRAEDSQLLADYDAFFARPDLILVPLSTAVVDLATAIRARHGLKTPDALQAACCLQLGDEHLFLTGDKSFRRVAGLHTRILG